MKQNVRNRYKPKAAKTAMWTLVIIIALVMLFPFYWQIIISFRQREYISMLNPNFLPSHLTVENYSTVFKNTNFFRPLFNTALLTAANILTNVVFGSIAAYAFARIDFRGSKFIFKVMLLSMMLPGVVTIVPAFQIIVKMKLVNSHLGVLLPGTVGVFSIFFLRSFFLTLPKELSEAARIDGAGEFKIFVQVYIPLVVPGLLTLSIFCFQGSWNSFVWPNLVLITTKDTLGVLTMVIRQYTLNNNAHYGETMALAFMTSLPVLAFFCFMQKYFISGITLGGVKG